MARNGTGTMAVPNSFSANTTIESAKINANFSDFASEITGSLPRDGQVGMTGAFKAASGTAAAPGVTFASNTTSGLYLIGASEIGASAGGTKVASLDSTGWKNATGAKYDAFPSGTKLLFYSDTAPTGWTIQTASLNDKALRVVSGSGAGGGTGGVTGGSTAFTSVFTSRTILKANIPNYTLSDTLSASTSISNGTNVARSQSFQSVGSDGFLIPNMLKGGSLTSDIAATTTISGSVTSGGSGTAMDFAVAYASVIIAAKD
jgi:hypothetical protein